MLLNSATWLNFDTMPCVKIINGVKLYIYMRDHNPPHFHAMIAEYEELIVISDLSTYSGSIPSRHRKKVINWAPNNKSYLNSEWNRLND